MAKKQRNTNSKKGNRRPTKAAPTKKKPPIKSKAPVPKQRKKPYESKLVFRRTTSEQETLWKKIFFGTAVLALLTTIILSLGSGINGDDYFQNIYSDKILSFYESMGRDTSTFEVPKGIIKIYGGLFEMTNALTNSALGYEVMDEGYHNVRHIWNAIFGCLAMLFTGLIAQKIAGWRAATIALLFIFLSPRFLGHSLMNPKDIPFATGYTMALYFMLPFVEQLPKPNWKTILGLAAGIAVAFGIRAGGLLLVAYLGLFAGLAYILKFGIEGIWKNGSTTLQAVGLSLAATLGGLILGTLFWPYGLYDPIAHIPEALGEFSQFSVGIKMLFQGEMIFGNQAPLSYLPTWLWLTFPIFIFVGLLLLGIGFKQLLQNYTPYYIFMLAFAFLFPILFVMSQGSTLYDGWRHLLFSYPPLVALVAIGWENTIQKWKNQQPFKIGAIALLVVLLLEPIVFIARNPNYPYLYFNPLSGGIQNAFGKYETDYWGVSVKQGLDWMEKEGIIGENMTDTITIVSNFSDALDKYARKKYKGAVRTSYVRYRQRYDKEWDYGLFASRFVSGSHLQNETWPPADNTVHTVSANGVPILAILKNETNLIARGVKAGKSQDWGTALELLEEAKQLEPNNEIVLTELARAYLQTGQVPVAQQNAEAVLKIEPENLQATNLLALCHLRTNKIQEAEEVLLNSIRFEPKNTVGYYYLGIIEKSRNNLTAALEYAKKSIETKKDFREAYQLASEIYSALGDEANANAYRQAIQRLGGR